MNAPATIPPDDGPPVTGRNDPAGIVAENRNETKSF